MKRWLLTRWLSVWLMVFAGNAAHAAGGDSVDWLRDDRLAFDKAREESKPVLLYLEAVWCHWCHVMDQQTYATPGVAELIRKHFIPLRIDQDSRPDLANRYRNYGWPATIFFTPEGVDMVKRQGFIAPESMERLLRAIIADPSPEAAAALSRPESFATTSSLSDSVRESLEVKHLRTFDAEVGGLTINQKFLERDSVELDLVLAQDGDAEAAARAAKTLDAAIKLIDPVWGGVYQYSTYRDWDHPHFEKLATNQGEYLRIYALAYGQTHNDDYLTAANHIARYVKEFLTSESGAFFTSQDADLIQGEKGSGYFALGDSDRRALGIPRIDQNIYARENGAIIEGLATLYEFGRDPQMLEQALRAARWIVAERSLGDGGFRHDQVDPAGPYLADTLAMGRAFLALYKATAEREWIDRALTAALFLERFQESQAGFATASVEGTVIRPVPHLDENIGVARFANLVSQITGSESARGIAEHAMRYLATPAIANSRITEAGILLADRELNRDPLHLTVVGSKHDASAAGLFGATLDQPGWYKRAEWWDKSAGPLINPDVTYPELSRPAAFVCTENRCSLPLFTPQQLKGFLASSSESGLSSP